LIRIKNPNWELVGQIDASEATGRHLEDTDGVIGLQLFASLAVTFGYPNARFQIDGGGLQPADAAGILTYTAEHGVPTIEIDITGLKARTDIDSRSPALLSLPLSLAKSLPLAAEPRVAGHGRTVGNEFDIYAASLKGEMHIGTVTRTNPRIDFVEIFPTGHVGFRFLQDLVVTFDPANHRVRFVKP